MPLQGVWKCWIDDRSQLQYAPHLQFQRCLQQVLPVAIQLECAFAPVSVCWKVSRKYVKIRLVKPNTGFAYNKHGQSAIACYAGNISEKGPAPRKAGLQFATAQRLQHSDWLGPRRQNACDNFKDTPGQPGYKNVCSRQHYCSRRQLFTKCSHYTTRKTQMPIISKTMHYKTDKRHYTNERNTSIVTQK